MVSTFCIAKFRSVSQERLTSKVSLFLSELLCSEIVFLAWEFGG